MLFYFTIWIYFFDNMNHHCFICPLFSNNFISQLSPYFIFNKMIYCCSKYIMPFSDFISGFIAHRSQHFIRIFLMPCHTLSDKFQKLLRNLVPIYVSYRCLICNTIFFISLFNIPAIFLHKDSAIHWMTIYSNRNNVATSKTYILTKFYIIYILYPIYYALPRKSFGKVIRITYTIS